MRAAWTGIGDGLGWVGDRCWDGAEWCKGNAKRGLTAFAAGVLLALFVVVALALMAAVRAFRA